MLDEKLRSLGVFLDVVFALMFFRITEFLPSFQDERWVHLPHGLLSLLASQPTNFMRVVFGLIVAAYYWNRKNTFLSVLARSNGVVATLSMAALTFLCLFMYALIADPTYAGGVPTLLLQSVTLLVASLLSLFALRYAIHANLIRPELKASLKIRLGMGLAASLQVSLGPFFPTVSAYTGSCFSSRWSVT